MKTGISFVPSHQYTSGRRCLRFLNPSCPRGIDPSGHRATLQRGVPELRQPPGPAPLTSPSPPHATLLPRRRTQHLNNRMQESQQLPRAEPGPGTQHFPRVSLPVKSEPATSATPSLRFPGPSQTKAYQATRCYNLPGHHLLPCSSGPGTQQGGKTKMKTPGGFWPIT